jgi:hypothetical protein
MRPRNRNFRFAEIMIGLLLVIAALSAGEAAAALVLLVFGIYLLARQFTQTGTPSSAARDERDSDEDILPAQPRADQVYAHALDAVRRAGLDPTETHVLPIDIGVMAFSSDQDPVIHRTRPVLDNIDYLQPFVQLRLPTRARGRIRFEILDSDGQVLFVHEEDHEFERGRNLITPAARLPIHDAHAMQGDWELRVSADNVLIAEHRFAWQESATRTIRRHLNEDGELSGEVRAMMAESRLQRMSLDDLLSEQEVETDAEADEETPRQQASRR